ncbi:hypothetical protein OSB04_000435 [Centaurea solstitialis]|uniref:Uncharacterized protein n=1 Tax=Centaurea solstitialis TaxID=347529 RepID=A0AA38WTU9_9ASTR|nr:hypothetical protein OSB04_000435 [Centaurea solstitialis]
MEENNGSDSNKHQNKELEASNSSKKGNSDLEGTSTINDQNEHLHAIIVDEVHSNRAKIVAHASISSSSSSSILLDIDYDEKDAAGVSPSSEENGSREDADKKEAADVSPSSEEKGSREDDDEKEAAGVSSISEENGSTEDADEKDAAGVSLSSEENGSREDANEKEATGVSLSSEENGSREDADEKEATGVSLSSEENGSREDADEKEATGVSLSSDENGSIEDEAESSSDSSTSSLKWSMVSQSPLYGPHLNQEFSLSPETSSPRDTGLNVVDASPMQSPVVQVMGRTFSYDPDRIPWSAFALKPANSAEWTATSNESLFSLNNGKSGELNKGEFSPGLPTVIETTSEIDRKSVSTVGETGEKEDLEIEREAPLVSINEDGGNGVDPASPV